MHINYSQTNLSTSSYSNKCLMEIVKEGNRDSLQKLLTNNPFEDSDLNKALFECIQHYTTLSHHQDCLIILLRYKADPNCVINDRTPLMSASSSGQEILVRRLLDCGAKVDSRDSQGNYPLFYALNKNTQNFDVIELLIDRMNNLNIEIAKKIIPIGFAIRKEFDKTVKKLIERNVTPYINEDNGDTLLHFACKQPFRSTSKQMKIIKLLLTKVGVYIKNKEGKAAFEYLVNEEMKEMIVNLAKPKMSEIQTKRMKKPTDEEEIDLSGDELQEQNSPHSKMNKIVEESDDEKKGQEKKEKGIVNGNGKAKKATSTLTLASSMKGKDAMKSITKSASNHKLTREIREKQKEKEKEKQKEKQKQKQKPTKYQRKKSSKTPLSKTTTKDNKQLVKEKQITKQLHTIKQVTNQEANKPQIKDPKLKQTKDRDKQKEKEKQKQKQDQKAQQLKQQLQKQAKIKQQKLQRQKALQKQIQDLQQDIHSLDLQIKPSDQYLLNVSDNFYISPIQISMILTIQIEDFVIEQQKICQKYYKISQKVLKIVSQLLTDSFKQFQTKVELFGSQSSGLCLQTSNIDLVIQSQVQPFEYLQLIQSNGIFNISDFKQIKFVKTTSVPIIKIQTGPGLLERKIDITFHTRYHNGMKCNNLIKEYLLRMNKLKPLVLVIKHLLFHNQLHDCYTGGLGSYSTFLLVVAFLQSTIIDKNSPDSLGLLLLEFLRYYGYEMDYIKKTILVYTPQYQQIPYNNNVFDMPSSVDFTCKLVLYDPLNPNNNVGRSTYRIKFIQQLLKLSYNKLLLNKRCAEKCKYKENMSVEEQLWKPCCLLKRVFVPETLLQSDQLTY